MSQTQGSCQTIIYIFNSKHIINDSFCGGLSRLHFLDDFLQFKGVQFPKVQCQIHGFVAVFKCAELSELYTVFVQFWMLLQVCLQLRYLPICFLACVDGTLQLFAVESNSLIVLLLYFEDVHQDHHFLLLFHVLCVKKGILMAFLNFSVSASCCADGMTKLTTSSASWTSYRSAASPVAPFSYILAYPASILMLSSDIIPSKQFLSVLASLLVMRVSLSSLISLVSIHLGSPFSCLKNLNFTAFLKDISREFRSELIRSQTWLSTVRISSLYLTFYYTQKTVIDFYLAMFLRESGCLSYTFPWKSNCLIYRSIGLA